MKDFTGSVYDSGIMIKETLLVSVLNAISHVNVWEIAQSSKFSPSGHVDIYVEADSIERPNYARKP